MSLINKVCKKAETKKLLHNSMNIKFEKRKNMIFEARWDEYIVNSRGLVE